MNEVVAQARDLAETGTGQVTVGVTTSIQFHQFLASAKGELAEDAREAVKDAVAEAKAVLDQVERARDDPRPESTKKRLRKVLAGGVFSGFSKDAQARAHHQERLAQLGGGTAALPVTQTVVVALEAAAIASSNIELDDATREVLAAPWGQRHLAT